MFDGRLQEHIFQEWLQFEAGSSSREYRIAHFQWKRKILFLALGKT